MQKPFIKWAGGKRWLVDLLTTLWQPYQNTRLVEPFTGGMSVALGLNPRHALLNDANIHLINLYNAVKKGLDIPYDLKNNAHFYYKMRDQFNALIRDQNHLSNDAARIFYYLMKTGFNGLCRFNHQGAFNVPFGQHKTITYRKDFSEYQPILKKWQLKSKDFEDLRITENDFIYADPPYDVEFRQYHKNGFEWSDQERLAKWLSLHKGPVIASNQATDRIIKLYKALRFKIFVIEAPRRIACNGDRKPALEMLALKGFTTLKGLRKLKE